MSDKVSDEQIELSIKYAEAHHLTNTPEYKNAVELKAARAVLDGECVWTEVDTLSTYRWRGACNNRMRCDITTYCGECRKAVKVIS